MIAVSLVCAAVLFVVPTYFPHVYAENGSGKPEPGQDSAGNRIDMPALVLPEDISVTVTVDGTSAPVTLKGGTVQDALTAAGVTLGTTDVCSPAVTTGLVDGMRIAVTRVTYEEKVTTQSVAFKTVNENDSTLFKGVTKVTQKGVNGLRTVVTRVTKVNGKVVATAEISNEITQAPVNKIVKVGTKKPSGKAPYYGLDALIQKQQQYVGTGPVPGTTGWRASVSGNVITDQFGNKVKFVSKMSGSCTAYYAAGEITALGYPAQYGIVAVDPKKIPYGTRMFICSPDGSFVYGYCVAGDTGSAMRAGTALIDLRFNSKAQCWSFFERRNMNVYILE